MWFCNVKGLFVALIGLAITAQIEATSNIVVMDSGSEFIKVGKSSDREGQLIPNLYGEPRYQSPFSPAIEYYGYDAEAKRGILNMEYPTQYGFVHDWEKQKKVWNHVLTDELQTEPSSDVIVMATPINSPVHYTDRLKRTLEYLGVRQVQLENEAILAMRAAGKPTGLLVQSGDEVTSAVAVVNGKVLKETYYRENLGGRDISQFISMKLGGPHSSGYVEMFKIKYGYVAENYEEEMKKDPQSLTATLTTEEGIPVLSLDRERFQCPEVVFRPELMSKDRSIQQLAKHALEEAPTDVQDTLRQNVVLAGGNTLFPGFTERFKKELENAIGNDVTVYAPEDRQFSIWNGGKLVADGL